MLSGKEPLALGLVLMIPSLWPKRIPKGGGNPGDCIRNKVW